MATEETDERARGHRAIITEKRMQVQQARDRMSNEGVNGEFSDQTHRLLAARAVQYFDVLHEYRSETAIKDAEWPDINKIRSRLGKTRAVIETSGGRGVGVATRQVPAVTAVPIHEILNVTKQLDDIAKDLGFSEPATETTPHDEADHDDLRGLVDLRSQDQALEELPGGD